MINKYAIADTLAFPDILRKNLSDRNEEYVFCDVDSLLTSISLGETIDFFIGEVYVWKKLESFVRNEFLKSCWN